MLPVLHMQPEHYEPRLVTSPTSLTHWASHEALWCCLLQGQAPTVTGNGIYWYGGPVLRNKAGVVVRKPYMLTLEP